MDFIRPYMDLYIDESHKPNAKVSFMMSKKMFSFFSLSFYSMLYLIILNGITVYFTHFSSVRFSLIFHFLFIFFCGGSTLNGIICDGFVVFLFVFIRYINIRTYIFFFFVKIMKNLQPKGDIGKILKMNLSVQVFIKCNSNLTVGTVDDCKYYIVIGNC